MKQPYIKPTRYVHDSGYRTFEVGYILEMDKAGTRVANKKVLGEYSDHIFTDYMMVVSPSKPWSLNMDLTLDGYIRFFSHQGHLVWDSEDYAYSSMGLKMGEWYGSRQQ